MKRRNFLLTSLTAAPLLTSGYTQEKEKRDTKGFKVNSGEGRANGHIQLKGVNAGIIDVKVSGKDTNGDVAIFEQTHLSSKNGMPLHVHASQDEMVYVLYGQYNFQVGDKKYSLKPGDTIFLPRTVPHTWALASENGKIVVTMQPAGKIEELFVTLADMMIAPTDDELKQLCKEHGLEITGAPLK